MLEQSKRPSLRPPDRPALAPDEPHRRTSRASAAEAQADQIGERIAADLAPAGEIGSGPLPEQVRATAERHVGVDLSGTELHAGSEANERTRNLNAVAMTEGSDVSFSEGRLDGGTREGRRLLGHELTHVAQQREAGSASTQLQEAGMTSAEAPMSVPAPDPAPMPPQPLAAPVSYALSVDIAGDTRVASGEADVFTDLPTTLTVQLNARSLSVFFSPPLRADVQWPWSDQFVAGADLDLTTGVVTPHTGFLQPVALHFFAGKGEAGVIDFMKRMVAGTPLASSPYDFFADPNPAGTLQQVAGNLKTGGGGPAVPAKNVTFSTDILLQDFEHSTEAGGARVGGLITATVRFSGDAATVAEASAAERTAEWLRVEGSSLVITRGGKDVARVHSVTINYGGEVVVGEIEVLNEVADLESLIRITRLLVIGAAAQEAGESTDEMNPEVGPAFIEAFARKMITQSLAPALIQGIRDNCYAIPDVNLCTMLGI